MMLNLEHRVHTLVGDTARRLFKLESLPAFVVEVPPNRALGDLAITLAFQLTASVLQPFVGIYTDKYPQPFSLPTGMLFTLAGVSPDDPDKIDPASEEVLAGVRALAGAAR